MIYLIKQVRQINKINSLFKTFLISCCLFVLFLSENVLAQSEDVLIIPANHYRQQMIKYLLIATIILLIILIVLKSKYHISLFNKKKNEKE